MSELVPNLDALVAALGVAAGSQSRRDSLDIARVVAEDQNEMELQESILALVATWAVGENE